MNTNRLFILCIACCLASTGLSDTFKHKQTGESFSGFATQKIIGSQTRVYNSDQKTFVTVQLGDYQVTYNEQGRRGTVVLVPLVQPEVFISQTVAEQIAESIIDASNSGPLGIILEIDNPGGSGEAMKIIASAVSQTTNCPGAAYISGKTYGGAFNAAAVVAVACRKVYISPTSAIGAVGPMTGLSKAAADYKSYLATYAPDTLVAYSSYAISLAQKHQRPEILVRGLVDKKLSIIEVNNPDGSQSFVPKAARLSNQTFVRTISEGLPDTSKEIAAAEVAGSVLSLSATDAVKTGLADEIAPSRNDVLTLMNIPPAQFVNAQGIESVIKKFTAAKRNIAKGLAQIDQLEQQAEQLDTQYQQVQEQLRTGTQTREVLRSNQRERTRFPDSYNPYYTDNNTNTAARSSRYDPASRERVTTVEPNINPVLLQNQLAMTLRELVAEYRRVINLAERWPGGLPPELPLSTLQNNMTSASTQLDNLYRMNTYSPNQNQNTLNSLGRRGY
jgi:ClpP class serine protease